MCVRHVYVAVACGCGRWLLLWPVAGGWWCVCVCVCVLKLLWDLEVATVRVCLIMVCIGVFGQWVSLLRCGEVFRIRALGQVFSKTSTLSL